jgi:putative transposase
MSEYRRIYQAGSSFFFTVVTHNRYPVFKNKPEIQLLTESMAKIKRKYPFKMRSFVILPDHIHCIWEMPEEDCDFSLRWLCIKSLFSRKHQNKKIKNIWQKRFWEHLIRDDYDFEKHMDYIHYNPVKHGYVEKPLDWEYGSFRYYVKQGFYHPKWGDSGEPGSITNIDFE